MSLTPEQADVVVVVVDQMVIPSLARLAHRHRWPLIQVPSVEEVVKAMGRLPLDVAMIQVTADNRNASSLIQWLRVTRQNILLVVVAASHQAEGERWARQAGADCYLPQADEVTLERTVAEIFHQRIQGQLSRFRSTGTHRRTELPSYTAELKKRQGA